MMTFHLIATLAITAILFAALIRQTMRAERNERLLFDLIDATRQLPDDVEGGAK
jgi:hypothetical protein